MEHRRGLHLCPINLASIRSRGRGRQECASSEPNSRGTENFRHRLLPNLSSLFLFFSQPQNQLRRGWLSGLLVHRNSAPTVYHIIFKDDVGKVLLEQKFNCGQLRPVPPVVKVGSFRFGDEVDAFYNDGWWEGNDGSFRFGDEVKVGSFRFESQLLRSNTRICFCSTGFVN